MPEPIEMETPSQADAVLMAVGETDAAGFENRPLMTGDVLRRGDGTLVALVQHPCAIRANGVDLLDRLLTCQVVDLDDNAPRSSWANEPYYRMVLTQFDPPLQVDFRLPVVLSSSELAGLPRVAVMQPAGVNLLMQRWVHHNTRVVVKTITYDAMCTGQYAEVDLIQDALDDLVPAGMSSTDALAEVDRFLGTDLGPTRGDTWRNRLKDPQSHGPARRALDGHVQTLLAALPSA